MDAAAGGGGLPPTHGREDYARREQRVDMAEALAAALVVADNQSHLHAECENWREN